MSPMSLSSLFSEKRKPILKLNNFVRASDKKGDRDNLGIISHISL